jgi:hypothetical protein
MAQHNSCAWSGSTPICCAASVTVLPYGQAAWTRALSVKRRVRREKQDLGRCVTVVASFSDVECQGGAQPAESPGSTIQWTDSCGSRKGRPATSVSPAPAARKREQAAVELRRAGLWFSEPIQPHAPDVLWGAVVTALSWGMTQIKEGFAAYAVALRPGIRWPPSEVGDRLTRPSAT